VLIFLRGGFSQKHFVFSMQKVKPYSRTGNMKSQEVFIVKQIVAFSIIAVVLGFLYG